jgi:hypothetical protein
MAGGSSGSSSSASTEQAVERIHTALAEPNRTLRQQRLYETLAAMTPESWEKTIEAFVVQTTHEGRRHDQEWHAALTRVGELDGERALKRFFGEDGSGRWSWEAASVLSGFASAKPKEARAWLEQLPEQQRQQMTASFLSGMAPANPSEATAFVLSLPAEQQPHQAGPLIEGALQNGGFTAASRVLERAREEKGAADPLVQALFRQVSERVFFSNWVGKTPERACAWVLDQADQPYVTPDVVHHAAGDYAIKDPLAAIQWVNTNSGRLNEQAKRAAVIGAVQRWTEKGFDGVTSWLSANAEHPLYDDATLAFSVRAATSDIEAAREWSATIKDPTIRKQAEQAIAGHEQARNTGAQKSR